MPAGTRHVGRGTLFGNPFTRDSREWGPLATDKAIRRELVKMFRIWLSDDWETVWSGASSRYHRERILRHLPELRGRNLSCWCKLDGLCHADILLEMAAKIQG